MFSWKLAVLAFSLESSALLMLFRGDFGSAKLAEFFLLHGGASACLALFIYYLLPRRYRQPKWLSRGLLFCFSFFIPLLGMIGLWLAILAAVYFPRRETTHSFANIHLPEFFHSRTAKDGGFGHVAIKPLLANKTIPTERRMKALLALEGVAPREAAKTLRNTLDDTVDDIRLVAYGILDKREKHLQAKIHYEQRRLEQAHPAEMRLAILRQLAELHWEMVYENLAQGDVRRHFIEGALGYANEAIHLAPEDSGLWFMKGRMLLELKDLDGAALAFYRASGHGLPQARGLPFLAEIAYQKRQFRLVHRLLAEIAGKPVTPRIRPLVDFWTKSRDPS